MTLCLIESFIHDIRAAHEKELFNLNDYDVHRIQIVKNRIKSVEKVLEYVNKLQKKEEENELKEEING